MADSMGAAGTGGSGGTNGEGATQPQRGVYWKRNDSMRLVHLLIDPELKVKHFLLLGYGTCACWN